MRKLLQNIYRKPKNVRDNYALAIAGSFTAVVCLFWVTAKLQTPAEGGLVATDINSPFETLLKKTKEQMASVKNSVAEIKLVTENVATSTTATTTTNAMTIVLSEEDILAAAEKASSTAASSSEVLYKEVLIGTTSASTTAQ